VQFYKSGVYKDPFCSKSDMNHCLALVGFGRTAEGEDFYVGRNSWGDDWGQAGMVWMARNRDNSCGIATLSSYPVV